MFRIVFSLLLFSSLYSTIFSGSQPSKILPEIFIDEIIKEDDWRWIKVSEVQFDSDDDEYISKTANGFSVSSNCYGVSFKCRAPYPIYWTIDKVEEIDEAFVYSVNTFTIRNGTSAQQNDNPSYEAALKFWVDSQGFTRNYSCRSAHDEHLQTSTFLFIQGPLQNYLVNSGKRLEVGVDDKDILEVPCGVATEDVEVILFKEEIQISLPFNISTWKKISTNDSIKYDPRIGFTLKVAELVDILGLYKCAIDENEEDVVHVNIDLLSPMPDQDEENFKIRTILQGSAKLEYEYHLDTMICCSNSDKKPKMKIMTCANQAECEISKHMALSGNKNLKDHNDNEYYWLYNEGDNLSSNCARGYLYMPIFWVRCVGDGIDVLTQFYYSFNSTNERLDKIENSNSFYTFPKLYKIIPVTEPAPLDSLVFITYNRLYGDQQDIEQLNSGESYYLFYARHGSLDDEGIMYSGQSLVFHCHFSPYIFSDGAYWEILWINGTLKRMPGRGSDYIKGSISVGIKLDDKIVSIRCRAGVWNSSEWVTKLISLTIQVPVVPQIDGPELSEVYMSINQTNKILECDFTGKPLPDISWQKDGKQLISNDIYTFEKQNGTSVLKIAIVTHETHGEYSCSVTNLAGTGFKSFIVYVEEESGISGWTITAVVFAFLIVGGYLIFILWKFQIHRRVLQHMTSATFQDPA